MYNETDLQRQRKKDEIIPRRNFITFYELILILFFFYLSDLCKDYLYSVMPRF